MPRDPARATHARKTNAALRAVDDPVVLERAARIVRAAIHRRRLRLDDLRGPIVQPLPAPDHGDAA